MYIGLLILHPMLKQRKVKFEMQENKVLIDLDVYNRLLLAEANCELIKNALFDKSSARLSYGGEDLRFDPNAEVIKNLCPVEYHLAFEKLTNEKGGENV